jgi:hypothetical protein
MFFYRAGPLAKPLPLVAHCGNGQPAPHHKTRGSGRKRALELSVAKRASIVFNEPARLDFVFHNREKD